MQITRKAHTHVWHKHSPWRLANESSYGKSQLPFVIGPLGVCKPSLSVYVLLGVMHSDTQHAGSSVASVCQFQASGAIEIFAYLQVEKEKEKKSLAQVDKLSRLSGSLDLNQRRSRSSITQWESSPGPNRSRASNDAHKVLVNGALHVIKQSMCEATMRDHAPYSCPALPCC